jgi:hypothetical protein
MRRRKTLILVGGAIILLLAGCQGVSVSSQKAGQAASEFVGKDLGELMKSRVENGSGLVVRDLSGLVGQPSEYNGDPSLAGQWLVVSICSNVSTISPESASSVEVGIVPMKVADETIDAIDDRQLTAELDCRDKPFSFSMK